MSKAEVKLGSSSSKSNSRTYCLAIGHVVGTFLWLLHTVFEGVEAAYFWLRYICTLYSPWPLLVVSVGTLYPFGQHPKSTWLAQSASKWLIELLSQLKTFPMYFPLWNILIFYFDCIASPNIWEDSSVVLHWLFSMLSLHWLSFHGYIDLPSMVKIYPSTIWDFFREKNKFGTFCRKK